MKLHTNILQKIIFAQGNRRSRPMLFNIQEQSITSKIVLRFHFCTVLDKLTGALFLPDALLFSKSLISSISEAIESILICWAAFSFSSFSNFNFNASCSQVSAVAIRGTNL